MTIQKRMPASPLVSPTIIHLSTGKFLRGGERQAIVLHQGLIEKGFASILLCRAGGELSKQNIAHSRIVPWHGEWDIAALQRLYRICKSSGGTIIHCQDAHGLSHGSIIGSMLRIPVIYTRRAVFPIHNNAFSRWKYSSCHTIIAVSRAVAQQCRAVAGAEKVHIVGDGVDWKKPVFSRTEARKRLGVAQDSFVIGSVGYFTQEKNLPLLYALSDALQTSKPEVRIVCIGPIDSRIGPVPSNLVCIGYKPDAVMYYNAFDAYASSSTHEGLGTALLDAVVRDIPAIAVDGMGTRDIFPDNWPLFPPGDGKGFIHAIRSLIDNYPDAVSQALICGKRARGIFSVENMVEKTIKLLLPLEPH